MDWIMFHPRMTMDHLGFIPMMLNDAYEGTAQEQLHRGYAHGGGWLPFEGHTWVPAMKYLTYPGDPPTHALAMTKFKNQEVWFFEHDWVMVLNADGTYEICRMD